MVRPTVPQPGGRGGEAGRAGGQAGGKGHRRRWKKERERAAGGDDPARAHDGTREELRRRFEGEAAVLTDGPLAPAGAVGEQDGEFVAGGGGGRSEDGSGGERGGGGGVGPVEFGECGGPEAVGAVVVELGVVEIEGGGAGGEAGDGGDGDGRGGRVGR
jgi:hypothetical protein